jgi:uncharacterized protein (DUF433 family)
MGTNTNEYGKIKKSEQDTSSEPESPPAKKKKRKLAKARIITNPKVCGGEPCIKGTRIPVSIILTHLASGDDDESILENFPRLKKEDIEACRQYAEILAERRRRYY